MAKVEKLKFDKQKAFVQEQLAEQVQQAFEAILALPQVDDEGKPKISLSGFERVEDQQGLVRSFSQHPRQVSAGRD